jgi:hypothetical protein
MSFVEARHLQVVTYVRYTVQAKQSRDALAFAFGSLTMI